MGGRAERERPPARWSGVGWTARAGVGGGGGTGDAMVVWVESADVYGYGRSARCGGRSASGAAWGTVRAGGQGAPQDVSYVSVTCELECALTSSAT